MFQPCPFLETLMVGNGALVTGVGSGDGDLCLLDLVVGRGSVSISEGTDISSVLAIVEEEAAGVEATVELLPGKKKLLSS